MLKIGTEDLGHLDLVERILYCGICGKRGNFATEYSQLKGPERPRTCEG